MSEPCPYCNGQGVYAFQAGDHFYKVTPKKVRLYRCQNCKSIYQQPIPDREEIAGFYPNGYWREEENPGLIARLQGVYIRTMLNQDLMRLVKKVPRPNEGLWLDVGCSRGDWPARIRDQGWRVEGIEADPRAAAYARKQHDLVIHESDGDSWRPPAQSYDVISFFHLLEHLRDPNGFVQRTRTALKPNGRIVLRIPNIRSWQARVFGRLWKGLEMPRHITLPSPDALTSLIENSGFELEYVSTWALRDGPPSIASSLFPIGEPTRQQILGKSRPIATIIYLGLTWIFTPLEVLAALTGGGSMMTIIARKTDVEHI